MSESFINEKNDPKFWRTIKQDWRKIKVVRTVKQDWKALKDFYLSAEQSKKLKKMNIIKGMWFVTFWLLKAMFYKLTPMRRILLMFSILLLFNITINTNSANNIGLTNPFFAYLVVIFILMLELKDKLIAHSELQEGKSVQIALLPDDSPDINGWDIWLFSRPANEVCGDLVDFLKLSDNKFYLALGDVAGKGLGAALLMVKLQSTLRAIADDYKNLQELGSKINAIFHRDSLPNKFASLVYLEGSAKNGTIRMLNAGHLPPLVISGDKISETQRGAPAIGLQGNTKYTEQEITLEKDDILFVFSDGLVEACNENDEFFEEPKVHEVLQASKHLPCHEIGKKIMLAVDRFVGERPLYDDLSMIILKKAM